MTRLKLTLFLGIASLSIAFVPTVPKRASAADIYACKTNKTGALRIVAPGTQCKTTETLIHWPSVDTDTLGALVCAADEVPLRTNTGQWACGTLAPVSTSPFVGFSTGTINGGQGMLEMHALCQADFGSSARLCTSKEFFLSPTATAPTTDSWCHPSPGGQFGQYDFTGMFLSADGSTCDGWGNTSGSGFLIRSVGRPGTGACSVARPVACCVR